MEPEIPLSGGNSSTGTVRVGNTVRKPRTARSLGAQTYMHHLREEGIDLPAPLGQDSHGRMVTEFVPGIVAIDAPPLTRDELGEVGAMVRAIHDASQRLDVAELGLGPALIPTEGADLACHCDLTPWNLVIGPRRVFIDWDGAAASTRVWDLAYSAQAFTLNDPAAEPVRAAHDLRAFADGYRADKRLRADLSRTLAPRARAMHEHLRSSFLAGRQPWGTMYLKGHGDHWQRVASYIEEHMPTWEKALSAP